MKTFREALLERELTLTAELALNPRQNAADIIGQAQQLGAVTDAVQVSDHNHAVPHISNIAVAAHLLRAGIDPVVHMSCRDRNRIAMQSDLLSARSLGVSNLLLSRGRELPADHRPPATSVFDFSALELIKTAAAVRDGEVFAGEPLPTTRDFYIGAVATVFEPAVSWQPEKLFDKANAGAQFVQLQTCLDLDILRDYVSRLVAAKLTWRLQVLATLPVLPSADDARQLRKNYPDIIIPPSVVKRLEQSADPEHEGVTICAEFLQELIDVAGISGATLMTPGNPETIAAAVSASGVRPDLDG